jgi:hypothetical protein
VIVNISKIEMLIHENESTFVDAKNFLMCGSCFWCASCLTGNRTMLHCPSCGNNKMQLMPVSTYESYKLDHGYINGMVSELSGLSTNKVGDRIS